jgi:tripartite-type tricarboxylate transporter receptor subunit TctC
MRPVARLIALLAGCCVFVAAANAQQYPSRTVKFLVPQAPAGATDVFARKVGQMLSEKWGQPVVVENRAGAAGVVGTDIVAKAPADGYTLLVTYAGSQAINPSLYANLPFDSIKAFQTVATVARTPFFLIANPRLPAKNLRDFVALARSKPDAYTFASSGNGSVNHLLGEMLKAEAGIKILHVPYRGVAEVITDVMAGRRYRFLQRTIGPCHRPRRTGSRARGEQRQPRCRCARGPDGCGIRLSRLRRRSVVGNPGACRNRRGDCA